MLNSASLILNQTVKLQTMKRSFIERVGGKKEKPEKYYCKDLLLGSLQFASHNVKFLKT